MGEKGKRSLACLAAVVLALAMVSATAMTAFADKLTTGTMASQSNDEIVYDTAYGVMHGQYALMMKTVTYEAEYNGRTMQYSGTITDLVKANGNGAGTVKIHTSSITDKSADVPGEWTNLRYNSSGKDINDGFMLVSDKDMGLSGVKDLSGNDIIACEYNNVELEDDCFIAVKFNDEAADIDFILLDGSKCGSASVPTTGSSRYLSSMMAQDYIVVNVTSYMESDSVTSTIYVHKEGDDYVVNPDIVSIFTSGGRELSNGFVYKATDGYLYYHPVNGTDVKLEPAENITSALVRNGIIELIFQAQDGGSSGSGASSTSTYYNTAGTKLSLPGTGSVEAVMDDAFVYNWYNSGSADSHILYDTNGTELSTFSAMSVGPLDATHYYAMVWAGDGMYKLVFTIPMELCSRSSSPLTRKGVI